LFLVVVIFVSCSTQPIDKSDPDDSVIEVNALQQENKPVDNAAVFQAPLDGNLLKTQIIRWLMLAVNLL